MRLIDADALIEEYDRVHVGPPGGARKLMGDAPTIEERKKGEWTIINLGAAGVFDCCRECKRVVKHKAPFYDFCPHCGADMRGGTE